MSGVFPPYALAVPGIAFCGPIGSGKSTMADALGALNGTNSIRASFADELRVEAAVALHAISPDTTIAAFITAFKSPTLKDRFRPFLQWLGTEYRREGDPDYWIRKLTTRMNARPEFTWLIDDCRFLNEYEALRARGFIFVRLAQNYKDPPPSNTHVSELDWPLFTFDITLDWLPLDERINHFYQHLHKITSRAQKPT